MTTSDESTAYAALGASSSKAGVLAAVQQSGLREFFCSLSDDIAGDPAYYSVIHADGAGTKAIVAYLLFRETGDPRYFRSLATDSVVMNTDDLACVGAFDRLLLSNTIGRNRSCIPDAAIAEIITGYRTIAELLQSLGLPLALGGGETADLGDLVRTLVVDSTVIARLKRSDAISTRRVTAGDIIIGLSSCGRASFESAENSSIGSNGLTLARHLLLHHEYQERYPEIADPHIPTNLSYRGPYRVTDKLPGSSLTVGEALLSPTRTFAPLIRQVAATLGNDLHGVIHCSGGGLTKSRHFGFGKRYIKNALFTTPALFTEIQRCGSIPWSEMYSVFNMGHRMELIAPASALATVVAASARFGIEARQIGIVEDAPTNEVIIRSAHGEFSYA